MKRKLALLLAVVMTVAMLPMNLFATSTNSLSKSVISVSGKAAYLEEGALNEFGGYTGQMVSVDDNNDIDYVVDGTYLQFRPNNDVTSGTSMVVTLTNAKWHFDGGKFSSSDNINKSAGTGVHTASKFVVPSSNSFGVSTSGYGYNVEYGDYNSKVYTRYGYVTSDDNANAVKVGDYYYNSSNMINATDVTGAATGATTSGGGIVSTVKPIIPIYELTISGADSTRATLRFVVDIPAYESTSEYGILDADNSTKGYVRVPLVTRSTSSSDDIKVTVGSNTTTLSTGSWVYGTTSYILTTTYVDDPQTARDNFYINKLIIKEQQIGSMENGTVRISLPSF